MNKIFRKECESSCEYVLPDYLGDVKKILSVTANAVTAGNFITDNEMHVSGVVNYNVLYADSENKLTGFVVTSDYDVAINVGNEPIDSYLDVRVLNFAARPTGPRKLLAKAQVQTSALVSFEEEVSVLGDVFDGEREPEILKSEVLIEECVFGVLGEREYAEEALRLAVAAEDIEIIASSGLVRIEETEATADGVNVRGELIITAIIRTEGGAPYAIKKSIPFDELVSIDGVAVGMDTMANGFITSVNCIASDDAEGSKITACVIAEFSAAAAKNVSTPVISDAYLKEYETVSSYSDYEYSTLVFMKYAEESYSAKVERNDALDGEIRNIIHTSADVRNISTESKGGGVLCKGDFAVCGVACQIDEANEEQYLPLKFSVPFEILVNYNCQIPENALVDASLSVSNVECMVDSDGISVRCDVNVSCHVSEKRKVQRLCECSCDGEKAVSRDSSVITVYYTEPGESLFEIAKKYHTTRKKIALDNKLDESVVLSSSTDISSVKKLIIR